LAFGRLRLKKYIAEMSSAKRQILGPAKSAFWPVLLVCGPSTLLRAGSSASACEYIKPLWTAERRVAHHKRLRQNCLFAKQRTNIKIYQWADFALKVLFLW